MSDRLERLINLVIALREARVPMTAEEIRERVAGYGQPDHAAFRRMFERDKADLRALGVPVEVAPVDRWRDREGYRIDPSRYDLEPIALDPDELAALALAVHAVGGEQERALRKLEVDAPRPLEPGEGGEDPPGASPPTGVAVALDAPHRDALLSAQLGRRRVRFRYRPPGRKAETREVDPAGLVHRAGHWYLIGHDLGRQARRAFRLDRIVSDVTEIGEAAPVQAPVSIEDALPPGDPVEAEIAVTEHTAWLAARRARGPGRPLPDGRVAYTVPARDAAELLGWVLRLGPDAEVLAPEGLRERAIAALERLAGHP